MKRKPRAYSRAKRKEQIVAQFTIWYRNGDTEPKTMYQIAKALDMTPQSAIYAILEELAAEGKLKIEWASKSGRWPHRSYSISQSFIHYHEKFVRRVIKVNKRGVAVGQMEMAL